MIGSNVVPFQGSGMPMAPQQPQMMLNPEFAQWVQLKEAYDAEAQKRQQKFAAACELIKQDACKSYRIDIEADSTVAADEEAEKRSRTEFLMAIVPFMQVIVPQMSQNPALRPLGAEMLRFAFHAFPASRQLEDALDEALQQMVNMPPQPDGKEHAGKSLAETKMETELGHAQIKGDLAQAQMKIQADQQAAGLKMMAAQAQAQVARDKAQMDARLKQADLALRAREMSGHEQLEMARIQRLNARNAQGLDE